MPARLEALESVVRGFLSSELEIPEGELTVDAPLVSSGRVDSAGLVQLAALLEDEADVVIPDADVNADHFDSIALILDYVAGRIGSR